MNYIGQLVGIIAIGVSFLIYIQTSRYKMVLLKLVTDVLWVAHHFLIFSYTAAATTGISALRELVFLPKKKNTYNGIILFLFSLLFVTVAMLTWKDNFSIFPAIASVLATLAFGSNRVNLIRFFAFLSSICMLIYGVHYFSVPTVINEILTQASIIISFIKERKMDM